MTRICAWCSREIGKDGNATSLVRAPPPPEQVTHGICNACRAEYFPPKEGNR